MDSVNLAHVRLKEMLEAIESGTVPFKDNSPETSADRALNQLHHRDFPALRRARARLSHISKDKKHDTVFRGRILAMLGTLNLYLDPCQNYTWRESSVIIATSQGNSIYFARSIRDWLHTYLDTQKLPEHKIGQYDRSLFDDEDFAALIKLHALAIASREGHFCAQDIVDFVASDEIQGMLEESGVEAKQRSISIWTARRWLKQQDWWFGKKKNGMYVDGHEREDVVKYGNGFCDEMDE
jgi:hypothetical protein